MQFKFNNKVLCSLIAIAFSNSGNAKELLILPLVTLDNVLVAHELKTAAPSSSISNIDTSLNTNTLNMGVTAYWNSNKINAQGSVNTEFINRTHISGSKEEDLDAFLQFNSSVNVNLWQDKLFLITDFSRSQQASARQINIDNKLIGGNDWFDVNFGSIALEFNSKITPFTNLTTKIATKKTQADSTQSQAQEQTNRINTEATSASFTLDNSNQASPITWRILSELSKTKRAQFNDVNGGSVRASLNTLFTRNFAFTASAEQSINQIEGNSSLSTQLEYKQVGIGGKWITSKSSEFEINVYNASSQRNSNEIYVGGKLALNLSKFSQLHFEKKKNALGESDSFSLSLQGKRFNLNSTYQKSININVRQGLSSSSPESFICPLTSQNISDCLINTGINLTNNEDFFQTSFSPQSFELNEQLTEQESLTVKVGFDNQRKIKLSITAEKSHQRGLESTNQNNKNISLTGLLLYKLSSNSELQFNLSTNSIENVTKNKDLQSLVDVTYSKTLGRKMSWQTFVKYTDITSEQRGYEIEEVQLGANIKYEFNSDF